MNRLGVLADPFFPALKDFVLSHTGLAYYSDKDQDLADRLALRLDALGIPNSRRYLEFLQTGRDGAREMECLIGELTIGETYFFRQIEHFDFLKRTIIPLLLEQNSVSGRIRGWNAGCATGEEPYSIALMMEQDFRSKLAGWDVSIVASDINPAFLRRARAACYREWSFRGTPHEIREQCFDRSGNTWLLQPRYRQYVTFQRLNLASAAAAFFAENEFDFIFCRNVMIYFSGELVQRTVARFWQALRPGGWLVVGHAEFNPEVFARFSRVTADDTTAYQKPMSDPLLEPVNAIPSPPLWILRPRPLEKKASTIPLPLSTVMKESPSA